MIKDLKQMQTGTEIRGFPLMIKTARKAFTDTDGITFQEVVFMDSSGEITGHILLGTDGEQPQGHHVGTGYTLWKSKTNICIMRGVLQDTDERKKEATKLVVLECFDAATPLSYDQGQELQAEDWKAIREDEIKGKIRHGLCCAILSAGQKPVKGYVLELQDFIITGE